MPVVTRRGVRIHYDVEGEGPPVIFHTGAGGDRQLWRLAGYPDRLRDFRRIFIDQRGRGASDRPSTVDAYRMEEFVEDTVAVLEAARADSVGFWGYSNGMFVGLALGATYPGRVRCLVGTGAMRYRDLSDLPPVDVESEIRADIEAGGVAAEVDRRMAAENDRFPPAIDANVRAGDPRTFALTGVAWLGWKGPKSALANFRAPILFLTGEKEDANRVTEATVAQTPGSRVVRVPGVGHLSVFSRSDLTVPLAAPFLRTHLA